jgi:hypothetical protein
MNDELFDGEICVGIIQPLHILLLLLTVILFKLLYSSSSFSSSLSSCINDKEETLFLFQPKPLNITIVEKLKTLGDYVPPWFYNQHLFALIPFSNKVCLQFEREMYFHPDGSSFITDTYPNIPEDAHNPKICVLLPGLASTSQDVS